MNKRTSGGKTPLYLVLKVYDWQSEQRKQGMSARLEPERGSAQERTPRSRPCDQHAWVRAERERSTGQARGEEDAAAVVERVARRRAGSTACAAVRDRRSTGVGESEKSDREPGRRRAGAAVRLDTTRPLTPFFAIQLMPITR